MLKTYNPGTGDLLGEIQVDTPDEVQIKIKKAQNAFREWSALSIQERCKIIAKSEKWIDKRTDEITKLVVSEQGKHYFEAYSLDVWTVKFLLKYWCKNAPKVLKPKSLPFSIGMKLDGRTSQIHYLPSGITSIISPWNNPIGIPAGQVAMALIAGNTVILKPSSETPLCGLLIRDMFIEGAELNPDILQVVIGSGKIIGPILCSPPIKRVMFTGSVRTGKEIAKKCAEHFIQSELELGGKDPMIVREDADIKQAVSGAVWGGFINSGQTCCSIRRIFVHEKIFERFKDAIVQQTQILTQGNNSQFGPNGMPVEPNDVGPMINAREGEYVENMVQDAIREGAIALIGAARNNHPQNLEVNPKHTKEIQYRYYFQPTILTNVDINSKIAQEEVFGPVILLWKVKNDQEALNMANLTNFGLTGSIWSRNYKEGQKLAQKLQVGTVCINSHAYTYGLPQTPWGGVKDSGWGRTHSQYGLKWLCDMVHIHTNKGRIVKKEPYWYPLDESKLQLFRLASKFF
jgi:succinate-semialdehyde dehydrogenase/glutarate-semialdehyde dehydrogenase